MRLISDVDKHFILQYGIKSFYKFSVHAKRNDVSDKIPEPVGENIAARMQCIVLHHRPGNKPLLEPETMVEPGKPDRMRSLQLLPDTVFRCKRAYITDGPAAFHQGITKCCKYVFIKVVINPRPENDSLKLFYLCVTSELRVEANAGISSHRISIEQAKPSVKGVLLCFCTYRSADRDNKKQQGQQVRHSCKKTVKHRKNKIRINRRTVVMLW